MQIILSGYGKMGKEIEAIALERGHSIALKIGKSNAASLSPQDLRQGDVVIEFSTPDTVLQNIERCFAAGVPIVVGTTGWYDQLDAVRKACETQQQSLFYASNFSLGVNLFFQLNRQLAAMMNAYPEYEVSMEEIHHVHKLDKPSGTAISLAKQILEKIDRKSTWTVDNTNDPKALHIQDIREGEVPGTHIVKYHSAIDDIEIMHKAHNRKGFALGAVLAAEFIRGKKGIFTMEDLLKF